MIKNDLITLIEETIESLKTIDNINCGGCGITAYYFSKQLSARKIKHKIVIGSDDPYDGYDRIESNKEEIKNFNNKRKKITLPFEHAMIFVKGFYFDGIKIYKEFPTFQAGKYIGEISLEDLELSINYCKWNTTFAKKDKRGIKIIINYHFSKNYPLSLHSKIK